mmetsp:Transcript_1805/g.3790  ORF Transcript_1805/g.3790 Transcript_1805/m.3790 type:complete len:159 (+) Transcript_1805:132-608(+)
MMAFDGDPYCRRDADSGVADLLTSVAALHGLCWSRGVDTVALTVPPNRFSEALEGGAPDYAARWTQTNAALEAWAEGQIAVGQWSEEHGPEGRKAPAADVIKGHGWAGRLLCCIDTAALLPYSEASPYWEADGLHMTAAGYEAFAEGLAPHLLKHVRT